MSAMTQLFESKELKAIDRCDGCSAAALRRVCKYIEGKELELFFCNHHYNKFEVALTGGGWWVQDG